MIFFFFFSFVQAGVVSGSEQGRVFRDQGNPFLHFTFFLPLFLIGFLSMASKVVTFVAQFITNENELEICFIFFPLIFIRIPLSLSLIHTHIYLMCLILFDIRMEQWKRTWEYRCKYRSGAFLSQALNIYDLTSIMTPYEWQKVFFSLFSLHFMLLKPPVWTWLLLFPLNA